MKTNLSRARTEKGVWEVFKTIFCLLPVFEWYVQKWKPNWQRQMRRGEAYSACPVGPSEKVERKRGWIRLVRVKKVERKRGWIRLGVSRSDFPPPGQGASPCQAQDRWGETGTTPRFANKHKHTNLDHRNVLKLFCKISGVGKEWGFFCYFCQCLWGQFRGQQLWGRRGVEMNWKGWREAFTREHLLLPPSVV